MSLMEKVIISWSGGKDSAMALYTILGSGQYETSNFSPCLTLNSHVK